MLGLSLGMNGAFSKRLSALDASFLDVETKTAPMHVGAALIFDAKPLSLAHGGLDFDRLARYTRKALDTSPRYRQRLDWVPVLRHPVWIDDDRFNINFHLRHTRLPLPGTERVLKRLVGRLFSQHLDRSRPLWEFWAVEGLEKDSFALVSKAHHCMVDGIAGVQLLQALLRPDRDSSLQELQPWSPRPAPGPMQLVRDEVVHRARGARKLAGSLPHLVKHAQGVRNVLSSGLRPTPRTPFTEQDVSPYRRFDWTTFDLEAVKRIKNAVGGTINDVIVTVTTGAVRRFLRRRGTDVDQMANFRTVLPVNLRKPGGGSVGNRIATLLADLPVEEPDQLRRMQKVIRITKELKQESNQAGGVELVEEVANVTTKRLLSELFKTAMRVRTYNLIITNIPGPPFPLYLLGARLKAVYPMVPLMQNQNLGIAIFSYCGALHFGFNADWASFPDVHEFVEDLETDFEELKNATTASFYEIRRSTETRT